jgi:trimethylamine--corrinoid protein Co-methyltransferase
MADYRPGEGEPERGIVVARARICFLSKEEVDLMHDESMRLICEMGVMVRSGPVLDVLADAGAEVDRKSMIAKLTEPMIDEALDMAPKRIRLCGQDPRHDLEIPVEDVPYVSTTGLSTHMIDIDTGKKRSAKLSDLEDFARLGDALDGVDFYWTPVIPSDVPELSHAVHGLWAALKNTRKHIEQIEVRNAEDARTQVRLASLVAGGDEQLRKRPIISAVCSPISPLSFGKSTVEGQVELAKAGVPIISMTMPLSGLTAPVTVAGTIAVVNAENLASLAITQFAAKGAPFVYSSDAVPANMRTGEVAFDAVEVPLLMAGTAQMAIRYGLPCMVGDWGLCGGPSPGLVASFSEISSTSLDTLSGTDMCSGIGAVDDSKAVSLEQMVIDAYTWHNWKGFLRRVPVTKETIAADVIRQVGHGNSFISNAHTARNFREALYTRDPKATSWEATLSSGMVPEAREIAKELLRTHRVEPLPEDVLRRGDAIVKEYEGRAS